MTQKYNGLLNVTKCLIFANDILKKNINEKNEVRVRDFKIITNKKDSNTWILTILGPDNLPYIIQHPQLKFKSHQWHVNKNSHIMPWFFTYLPDDIYLFLVQWWMRAIAYKAWTSNAERSMYYTDLFGNFT